MALPRTPRSSVDGYPAPAVLQLVTRMNIGGPARQVLLLQRELPRHLPALLAAGSPPATEGELIAPDVPVHRVPLVRPVRPRQDLAALAAVHRLLNDTCPGILHTHMAKAGLVGRVAALGCRERPRLVHTFHGHVLQGYFGKAEQQVFLQAERLLARRTDVLVAVSEEVRDELLDLGVGRPGQYEVLPLGVDLDRLLAVDGRNGALRSALGLDPSVKLAGVLGRLVPVKDHASLFRAITRLPGLHLAVLGDGELRAELERLAAELGIAGRVHFTGWWHDVPSALADLDVVVLSSRNEGTPLVLIEALAAGRPVVATDVGGVRAVVEDGTTGWLCDAADPDGLAVALAAAVGDPAEARIRSARGRQRMAERYGAARMVADHVALYEGLLASRGNCLRIGR